MADDKNSGSREPRSSSPGRAAIVRSLSQQRAFIELSRVVGAGEQGIWTGALPLLLSPSGATWGAAYRLAGNNLELSASEGLTLALRPHLETFDLARHAAFAACRAVRTRRAVSEERVFTSVLEGRVVTQLEGAGLGSATAVPIVHRGSVLGVLLVGAGQAVDGDAITFLDAAASFVAPAIALGENARQAPLDRRSSNPPRAAATPRTGGSSNPPRAASPSSPPRRASSAPPPGKVADVGRAAVEAVQQCTLLVRRAGIDMRLAADEGCVAVGDAGDFGLAIAHLVTNAAEAAAERAPLAGAPSQPRRVRVSVMREGASILVSVDDSGRGVPPDLRGRVFEPGFSTKGKGRGNGLHVVRKIAQEVGGHVEVGASDLGGASFRMVLPASVARPEQTTSGTWQTGATWPQLRVSRREGKDGGEGGGAEGSSEALDATPARGRYRRVGAG